MCYVYNLSFAGENVQLPGKTASYWSPSSRDVIPASVPTDVYSRKVFVGGLPPDIDDGKFIFVFCVLCIIGAFLPPLQMRSRTILRGLDL